VKVKDIMEPIRRWLTPEMTIDKAIHIMKTTKRGHGLSVNGIVVLDGAMNLVGILSTIDILRLLIPHHVYFDDNHGHINWESLRHEKTVIAKTVTVAKIMTEDVRVIAAEETLLLCADRLLTEQVRRLPVTRSDGKVVGIVYLRDVYNALTELLTH